MMFRFSTKIRSLIQKYKVIRRKICDFSERICAKYCEDLESSQENITVPETWEDVMFLTKMSGDGKLIHRPADRQLDGEVQLEQLLNGKIMVRFSLLFSPAGDSLIEISDQLILEGLLENQYKFRCDNLSAPSGRISKSDGFKDEISYSVPHVYFVNKITNEHVDVEVELTNFHCESPDGIEFELNGFKCKLEDVSLPQKAQKLAHARNYHHPIVKSILRVNSVEFSQIQQLEEFIKDVVFQLSIASRGMCFATTIHIIDNEKKTYHKMIAPQLPYKYSSLKRLIRDEHIPQFLNETFQPLKDKFVDWKIHNICDYYFHSLSLNLLWPMSLGVLTALESLKDSFYKNNPDEEKYRNRTEGILADQVVDEICKNVRDRVIEEIQNQNAEFTVNDRERENIETSVKTLIQPLTHQKISNSQVSKISKRVREYIIEQIRIQNLSAEEKNDMKTAIERLIRFLPYKYQLVRMFEQLEVDFDPQNVSSMIKVRNKIIHEGYYEKDEKVGWEEIENAVSLVEKTLLSLLEYTGDFLPYNRIE